MIFKHFFLHFQRLYNGVETRVRSPLKKCRYACDEKSGKRTFADAVYDEGAKKLWPGEQHCSGDVSLGNKKFCNVNNLTVLYENEATRLKSSNLWIPSFFILGSKYFSRGVGCLLGHLIRGIVQSVWTAELDILRRSTDKTALKWSGLCKQPDVSCCINLERSQKFP